MLLSLETPTSSLVPATGVTDLDNLSINNNQYYGPVSSLIEYADSIGWDPNTYLAIYHLVFTFTGDRPISSVLINAADSTHKPTSYHFYDNAVGGNLVGSTTSVSLSTTTTITRGMYTTLYLEMGGPSSGYQVSLSKVYFYQ